MSWDSGFCLIPAVSHLLLHKPLKTWQLKRISDGFCGTASWEGLSWWLDSDLSRAGSQEDASRGDSHLTAGSWIPQSQSFETAQEESSVPL